MLSMMLPTIVFTSLTFSWPPAPADGNKSDLKALNGVWEVVAIEIAGNKVAVGKGSPDKVIINGDKITIQALGKPFTIFKDATLKLDVKKKPKAIDIVPVDRDFTVPGIYEVGDTVFKLAIPRAPSTSQEKLARPESFETKNNRVMLLTMKRSKK